MIAPKRGRMMGSVVALSVLVMTLAASASPAFAQDSAEQRIRQLEAQVRALQRKVFPGADGKYFTPEITAPAAGATAPGSVAAPAASAVTDALRRLDGLEAQLARLTGSVEQNDNRLRQVEAKLGLGPAAAPPAAAVVTPSATPAATVAAPAVAAPSIAVPVVTTAPAPATVAAPSVAVAAPVAAKPAVAVATPKPATPAATTATRPSPQRLAQVRAIEKPQTDDPGDDEYSYGYRLWEAKFYPEAEQQLKMYLSRYPRHARLSFARNLLGRAYLDEGNAREAASWFLQNYNADKRGDRAPDSLLYLAVAMKKLNDTNRACIALAEFTQSYPAEAAGRLRSLNEETRSGLKCSK